VRSRYSSVPKLIASESILLSVLHELQFKRAWISLATCHCCSSNLGQQFYGVPAWLDLKGSLFKTRNFVPHSFHGRSMGSKPRFLTPLLAVRHPFPMFPCRERLPVDPFVLLALRSARHSPNLSGTVRFTLIRCADGGFSGIVVWLQFPAHTMSGFVSTFYSMQVFPCHATPSSRNPHLIA